MQRPALVAFAKDPTRVAVKTRLSDTFNLQERSDLYTALLKDILNDLTQIDVEEIYLACHPDPESNYFKEMGAQFNLNLIDQVGNDLGERMANCFDRLLPKHSQVIIFGTDTPLIPLDEVKQAVDTKKENSWQVLLGSALDGGYYCIGLNSAKFKSCPDIFRSVKWSTESVLEKTLENCKEKGFSVYELSGTADIDTVDDLKNLIAKVDISNNERLKEVSRTLTCLGWSCPKK